MATVTLKSEGANAVYKASPAAAGARAVKLDDMMLLRTAADLTRDLTAPSPRIYWVDLLASVIVGYGALALAIFSSGIGWTIGFALIAMFGLYRAGSFIHEVSHIKHSALPGFRLGWNMLVGIPLSIPSFMYEGVHNLHHARTRYGTADDPEYLPLALMKPWTVPLFVLAAALGPIALIVRYALLAPLSVLMPPLRKLVVARYSGLVINPDFRRRPPEGDAKRLWRRLEVAASLWAIALVSLVVSGIIPLRAFAIFLAVTSGTAVLNQVRTLVAHLWENDGKVMSVTQQFLDSVNVPPPSMLPMLWAPVGLRYHALHHLLPGLPYHALGEAHRRISRTLGPDSTYRRANYRGLFGLAYGLVRGTITGTPIPRS